MPIDFQRLPNALAVWLVYRDGDGAGYLVVSISLQLVPAGRIIIPFETDVIRSSRQSG